MIINRYSLLFIFFIFNSFSVSTSAGVNYKNITTKVVEGKPESIQAYPLSVTKDISVKIDSVLKRFNKRQDFNGSVLVAKNGKLIFNNEYGYADFNKKTKIDKNSVFQLASVSKQFTATAILILYEKGLIDLDDTVVKYFNEFPYEDITIRQLLNHTSGLPKYFWLAEHKWNNTKPPTNIEMIKMMEEHKLPLFFKPGSRFDYSNTGYFVLASIIEKVSKMNYGDFLNVNIFEPLQMNNSYVYRFEQDIVNENQLSGYRLYRRWRHAKISGTVNDAIVGDKNVYSTAEDLLKWINGLNSGKIISKHNLKEMYSKGETKYGRKVPYGYGFRINDNSTEKVIYHNGKWNGFSTSIKQYTNSDLVIITLEHSNYKSLNYLNNKVKTIVEENFDVTSF
ncbi:MAG: serine hydrolase domain-containing protein [Bacteroidota bacterium]